MQAYETLWDTIQQICPGSTLAAASLQLQLEQYRSKLLNLFQYKGPDASMRQAVRTGKVQTPNKGELSLDFDARNKLVPELSDMLQLNELACAELIESVSDKFGAYDAECACGMYLAERGQGAKALALLLMLQLREQMDVKIFQEARGAEAAGPPGSVPFSSIREVLEDSPLIAVLVRANDALLSAEAGGRNTLISRIVAVVKDHAIDSRGFETVRPAPGMTTTRATMLLEERAELCRALLYAVLLSPSQLKPATVADILSLQEHLVGKVKAAGSSAPHLLVQQASSVLLAAVAALSLKNVAGGLDVPVAAMADLLRSQEVKAQLEKLQKPENGLAAVVCLAWALTKDAVLSNSSAGGGSGAGQQLQGLGGPGFDGTTPGPTATALLEDAGKGRALGTLSAMLSCTAFCLEDDDHRHVSARIVYFLLTDALEFDRNNNKELVHQLWDVSTKHNNQKVSSSRGGAWFPPGKHTDLMAFAFPAPAAPAPPAAATGALAVATAAQPSSWLGGQQLYNPGLAQHDDLSSLLEALAAVYRIRPGLWHDMEAPTVFAVVNPFMSSVVTHSKVNEMADVMVSILGLMTALAVEAKGSRYLMQLFKANTAHEQLQAFTWQRLFILAINFCQRYEDVERAAALHAAQTGQHLGLLQVQEKALMAPGDAAVLVAYLDLFTAVVASGELDEVRASLQAMERELAPVLGTNSLNEPLFQLMCHGVPTRVKAAVDRSLTAMARFKDAAPAILGRLLQAVVVNGPSAPREYAGFNPSDLLLQITQVEARQEDYSETLAFLNLINALLDTLGPLGLPEGAIAIAHYTQFVLQHVVGQLWQRAYRDPSQKWQLAEASFRHCQLVMQALASWPANVGTQFMMSRQPPGLSVLLSLMQGQQLEKTLLHHVLGPGQAELEASLSSGVEGPARLRAVLAGFRLLNTALAYDEGAAEAVNSLWVRERLAPLKVLLTTPPQRLIVLLQYIMLTDEDLQYEVISLLSTLSAHLPDIVHILQPNFDDTAVVLIREGFAHALGLALFAPSSESSPMEGVQQQTGEPEASPAPATDARAGLLLDIMLGTLLQQGEPPSLAHLLLGFDTASPPTQWYYQELMPQHHYSCLTVLLTALQDPELPIRKPGLFAKCLQLLFCIAEPALTCEAVFSLLQPSNEAYGQLIPQLGGLLVQPMPGGSSFGEASAEADVHEEVAALRQRAALLQLYGLALLRCKQEAMVEPVLTALIGAGTSTAAVTASASGYSNGASAGVHPYAPASGSAALQALQHICGVALPQQGVDVPPDLLQIHQEMVVDNISVASLFSQPSAMEGTGVVTTDEYGQPRFDFEVLQRLLQERFDDYVSRTGGRGGPTEAAAREAVQAALTQAAALNAHALVAGAQFLAVQAWSQAISITFIKSYKLLNRSTAPGCGPELLHSTLLGVLQLVAALTSRGQMALAAELAGCCRLLMSKLQELAASSLSLGLPGDPLSQVRLPVRCEALLRLLLECLRSASGKFERGGRDGGSFAVRSEMYVCLIQYLHFCRGSKLGDCPPLVLSCLLSGAGPGTSAAQLDALQQQLEEVNSRLLRGVASDLIGIMLGDVLQPPHKGGRPQAVALHLLTALLAADKSTALAEVCHREKLPKALLESVVSNASSVIEQHSSKTQGALQVLEGQLFLLLALTMAGGPAAQKASTKAVADAGVLPSLARCKPLNFLPETPSDTQRQNKAGTRRYRLVRLVCPVLRLVLSLLGGAPGSAKMVSEALEFCRGQQKLLARLLKEAAAPASPSWTPGDEELEQAALAVSLLARLPAALRSPDSVPASLAGGAAAAGSLSALRDDMWLLWQALAGHDRGSAAASGILVMMAQRADAAAAGSNRLQLERRRALLLQLRVGLAAVLRALVKPLAGEPGVAASAAGGAAGSGSSELLQLVGPDDHMTMDVMGRPTLLQVHNTADQAVSDVRHLAQDLELLLDFLARPEAAVMAQDVSNILSHWGPPLAALSSKPEAQQASGGSAAAGGGASNALVLAGAAAQQNGHAAAAAGLFGGLDPAAARRLARQSAAKGAAVLLGQLSKQLSLIEQCLVIVLLHLVQCLPRPDTASAVDADDMQMDAAADGSIADALMPSPSPDAATQLGDENALRFFAARMRNVCSQAAGMGMEVRKVLGMDAAPADAGAAVGARQWLDSLDAIDLLTRRLNAYLSDR